MLLKDKIEKKILECLQQMGLKADLPVKIEYARDEKFGDYACTICMDKRWRDLAIEINPVYKNPQSFAEALANSLRTRNKKLFSNVQAVKPGFINLTLTTDELVQTLKEALKNPARLGRSKPEFRRNIIFEYVSANPTGPLNVVSARAAALGDSCCNLLEAAGHDVYREYYVNDHGNQLDLLGQSSFLRYLEFRKIKLKMAEKKSDGSYSYPDKPGLPFPAEGYHGEYLKRIARKLAQKHETIIPTAATIKELSELSYKKDVAPDFISRYSRYCSLFADLTAAHFLDGQKKDLKKFRVTYRNFFKESSLHKGDAIQATSAAIKNGCYEKDGKTFFRSTEYGDDKDRVILRTDKRPTYLLADIAYHRSKIERGFQEIYDIWGPDHHGYIARLKGAVTALGYSGVFKVLIAQQVNMLDNGQPVVMSKRAGKLITMKELMQEIPVDVLRYFFVMRSFDSHLDFDLSHARDTSEKNPFYYVAYAHARIRSIFEKAAGVKPTLPADLEILTRTPERRRLLWLVARFPEEVRDAAESMEPHRMTAYLYQIASALSQFYAPRENRIIELDEQSAGALIALLAGVSACLKNGLALLGMKAPDRLERED